MSACNRIEVKPPFGSSTAALYIACTATAGRGTAFQTQAVHFVSSSPRAEGRVMQQRQHEKERSVVLRGPRNLPWSPVYVVDYPSVVALDSSILRLALVVVHSFACLSWHHLLHARRPSPTAGRPALGVANISFTRRSTRMHRRKMSQTSNLYLSPSPSAPVRCCCCCCRRPTRHRAPASAPSPG